MAGTYDMHIHDLEAWGDLERDGLGIVIDPVVLRIGQFFLEGARGNEKRWNVIEKDIPALVEFFDLIVLRDRFPAFNWHDSYDMHLDFGDALGDVLNTDGDKTVVHVDMEHRVYRAAKDAAIQTLGERINAGPFIARSEANELLTMLDQLGYEWDPSLEALAPRLGGDPAATRMAKFLLGQLVFSAYSQQSGAPHVLSTARSRLMAALGVGAQDATRAAESKIFDEVRRRCVAAGASWRATELPWTPSFLPFLVSDHRDGPATLLRRAKDLRSKSSVDSYRRLRRELAADDSDDARAAGEELATHADKVSDDLKTRRAELEITRKYAVEYLPKAVGKVAAPVAGAAIAGTYGAAAGVAIGQIAEDVLARANQALFGWVLSGLPFRSARKLLSRAVRAEVDLQQTLVPRLREIWLRPD